MARDSSSGGKPSSARSQGRPSREETEAIRRNLHSAAMAALLEQGDGATMNGIALRAGISRKALYARYSSRNDLFADVIRHMIVDVEPLPVAKCGNTDEKLSDFIAQALELLAKPQAQAVQRLIAFDPFYLGGLRKELQEASAKMFFYPLLGLIEDAMAAGSVWCTEAQAMTQVILDMIFSHGLFDSAGGMSGDAIEPVPTALRAHMIREIIVRGLLGPDDGAFAARTS